MNFRILLIPIISILLFTACRKEPIEDISTPPVDTSTCTYVIESGCASVDDQQIHLLLGNPSDAIPDRSSPDNYLISLPQYKLSYSKDRGIPNWVAWHLSEDWLGDAPRQNDFRAYTDLPDDWFFAVHSDYTNTGFNRGHNAPSADRKCSEILTLRRFSWSMLFHSLPLTIRDLGVNSKLIVVIS